MASRFDYPDPGQDPEYCNALAADPDDETTDDLDTSPWDPEGTPWPTSPSSQVMAPDPDDLALCYWCQSLYLTHDHHPYCSAQCSAEATLDGEE